MAAIVCLLSMLTAFLLAAQIGEMRAGRRLRWLAALGFVSGGGIWATHFIAMLAYQPNLPTAYDPLRTMLSIGVGVAASTTAWRAFFAKRKFWRLAAPAIFAVGVAAMHKTGMTALQTTGRIAYDGSMIAGSIAVGITLSYAGFHWAERRWRRIPVLPALALVLAICAIHFGAMAAVTIYPESGLTIDPSTIESGTLAFLIATLAAAILGVGLVTALAEARIARHAQREAERLKSFSESALEALAILENDVIVDANTTFWGLAGYDPVHPPEGLVLSALLPEMADEAPQRRGPGFFNTRLRACDGEQIDVEMAFRRGQLLGVDRDMVVLRDVSEQTAAAARIAHLAAHDPLTGAANRLSLNHLLADALTRSTEQAPVALLCLDLDRFKAVNDIHGHPTGDALLVEVTRRIRECMTGNEALARLGGDEFAIVQPGGDQPHRAASLARRILDSLAV
ncbi:MAG TPA: diguanylate cyclase, partial [Sphingomonas sp.]|nr:diguanylate cyclase [Sphingomonas sp.]